MIFIATLSIGQLASLAEVNPSTIRYYESIGLLPPPARTNGQRKYSEDALERIKFIKVAQQTGFSIHEIAVLAEGFETEDSPSEKWQQMAKSKRAELEEKKRQIDSMLQILDDGLQCKCLTWSECFGKIQVNGTCC